MLINARFFGGDAGLFCGNVRLVTEMQGSFAEMQGSVAEMQESFAEMQDSFAEI